jgi:hypothetical protein
VEFMELNSDHFKWYIAAKVGGGTRSSSRRGGERGDIDLEAVDMTWANYIKQMKKPGTYADNHEIAAVSAVFGYTVEVFGAKKTVHTIEWGEKPGVNGTIRLAHHVSGIPPYSFIDLTVC